MIYFVYLFFLCFLLYWEYTDRVYSKFCRIAIPVLYALLMGLRGRYVGVDTITYYHHFYRFGAHGCSFVEPGFDWLNRILFVQGFDAMSLFLAMGGLTSFFFYLALNRLQGKYYTITAFCVYLLTFVTLVNVMRQGLAIAIFLYAYKYIEEKKILPYIGLLLIASMFHATALLLIPLYFIERIKLPNIVVCVIYAISFVGVFVDTTILLPAFKIDVRDYSRFAEGKKEASASLLGFTVASVLNIFIFLLLIKNNMFKKKPALAYFALAAFILKNIGFNVSIFGRLAIYFSPFVYFLYPYVLSFKKDPLLRSPQVTILVIVLIHTALWINTILSSANRLLPYYFFWE